MRVAIRKLEGVESVEVSLDRGVADIRLRAGNRMTLPQLRQVVKRNGFNARDAAVTVVGELIREAAGPTLSVVGIGAVLTIAEDSARPEAYRRIRDQLATLTRPRVTLDGIVTEPRTKGGPDRLVVQSIESDPKGPGGTKGTPDV